MRAQFNTIMLIVVGLLFATSFTAFAADKKAEHSNSHKNFDTYARIYNQATGYDLKAPAGYIDAGHRAFLWSPQSHKRFGHIKTYRMRLCSSDKQAMIVYPIETYQASEAAYGEKNGVKMYVALAKKYPMDFSERDPQTGLSSIVTSPEAANYYKKISGKDVRKWFNADYVYVGHFELQKPFGKDDYTHAMVVSFHGKQRYEVVCFLKSGKKSLRDKVFNDLKGNIKLCDNPEKYTTRTNCDALLEIVELFGENPYKVRSLQGRK